MQIDNTRIDINISIHEIGIILRSLELEYNTMQVRSITDFNTAAMMNEIINIKDLLLSHVHAADKTNGTKNLNARFGKRKRNNCNILQFNPR